MENTDNSEGAVWDVAVDCDLCVVRTVWIWEAGIDIASSFRTRHDGRGSVSSICRQVECKMTKSIL